MTAMTVFFPLDTARLRLQGKCQNLVSLYNGVSVHLSLGTCKGGCRGVFYMNRTLTCVTVTSFFQLKVILPFESWATF